MYRNLSSSRGFSFRAEIAKDLAGGKAAYFIVVDNKDSFF